MEEIDFFNDSYRCEPIRDDECFGIKDGDDDKDQPAYTSTTVKNPEAIVVNSNREKVQFIPLDRNIKITKKGTTDRESLCDGMLYIDETYIAFIELKAMKQKWISKATLQLKNTIQIFKEYHRIDQYKVKYAYAANRKHGYCSHTSHRELKFLFFHETEFKLRLKNTIILPMDEE